MMKICVSSFYYEYVRRYNPTFFDNPDIKVEIVDVPGDYRGFICLDCGSRGWESLFQMMSRLNVIMRIRDNRIICTFARGDAEIKMAAACKNASSGTTWSADGAMIVNANPDLISCVNCGGCAVMDFKLAVERCMDIGCGGCFICDDFMPREAVLRECAECPVVDQQHTLDSPGDFDEQCMNYECRLSFVVHGVYQLKPETIRNHRKTIDIR